MTGTVKHLPGTKLTAQVMLHRTIGKLDRIKAVAVIIQWDDDTFSSDWSSQKTSDLCMGSMAHENAVRAVLTGADE